MANPMDKVMKWIGMGEDDSGEEDIFAQETEEEHEEIQPARKSRIMNFGSQPQSQSSGQMKVVVVNLSGFEDAKDVADHLKKGKPVVINLEKLDAENARRSVDFLSGAVYGINGNIKKVSDGIFLIAPCSIGIAGDYDDEIKRDIY